MRLETDLTVIARVAERKEKENWRFRSFLKSCDKEEIGHIVHDLQFGEQTSLRHLLQR